VQSLSFVTRAVVLCRTAALLAYYVRELLRLRRMLPAIDGLARILNRPRNRRNSLFGIASSADRKRMKALAHYLDIRVWPAKVARTERSTT
jgi:hypothetical protein